MTDLNDLMVYFGACLFVIALIALGAYLLKGAMGGGASSGGGLLRGRERRLGVVEASAVDGRRKLILLRRDNIEHLIMTGGPVDVLIESGIDRSPSSPAQDESVSITRDTQPVSQEGSDHD